jgi:hypothetical protein
MGSTPVTPSGANGDGPSLAESAVTLLPFAIVAAMAIAVAILLGTQIMGILENVGTAIPA